MPAVVGIGLVVGIDGRSKARSRPRGGGIIGIDPEGTMNGNYSVTNGLVPARATCTELLGSIPQRVRNCGLPAEPFVAPAEHAIALSGVVAQRRAAESPVAEILRCVDQQDARRQPRRHL